MAGRGAGVQKAGAEQRAARTPASRAAGRGVDAGRIGASRRAGRRTGGVRARCAGRRVGGTLIRYLLGVLCAASLAQAALTRRCGPSSGEGGGVASTGLALALTSDDRGARRAAVELAAVARAAQHDLGTATGAQKQAGRRGHRRETPTSAGVERARRSILGASCESTVGSSGTASVPTAKSVADAVLLFGPPGVPGRPGSGPRPMPGWGHPREAKARTSDRFTTRRSARADSR